jgi:HSP20 family molecular chaperone IbpA
MEDTPGDSFRKLQEILEQMIRDSMEQGNFMAQPMGFTIVIRGGGSIPSGQFGGAPENGGILEPLIEVHEEEVEILVLAELPGVSEDQVRVDLEEGALRIAAADGARRFVGRAELPPVDPGSLRASCRNGVLEVKFRRIPEAPE